MNQFFPVLDFCTDYQLIADLSPPERRALGKIVAGGDILMVEGRPYLLAPVDAEIIDTLATFDAENEDRENDLCDEPGIDDEDDDPMESAAE